MKQTKYEAPKVEIIEFLVEDNIAASGVGTALWEEIWGSTL